MIALTPRRCGVIADCLDDGRLDLGEASVHIDTDAQVQPSARRWHGCRGRPPVTAHQGPQGDVGQAGDLGQVPAAASA